MIIIKNIRVIGRENDGAFDVTVESGKIKSIAAADRLSCPYIAGDVPARIIDGSGLYLAPGFVDLHVHFRDPGFTDKEDIASGSRAAARGGYTTVCCMPNTSPAIDCADVVEYIDARAGDAGLVNVFSVGALTMGQKGVTLSDMAGMDGAETLCRALTGHGIAGVSEDGKSLMDESLMLEALALAKSLGLLVMDHAEDASLAGGCVNEGAVSEKLGVKGLPARAETNIVERDVRLAAQTGARIHIQHVSATGSIELIRKAKAEGIPITAETAPHYFALTEETLTELPPAKRAQAKMNPPLRTEKDRLAIIEGLSDGTIDILATDHAPHEASLKSLPLEESPFGIVGLETAFALSYTELVRNGILTLTQLINKMSAKPASLIGLNRGVVQEGATADLAILDIDNSYKVDSKAFKSKGKNTPFEAREVYGNVRMTLHNGEIVYNASEYLEKLELARKQSAEDLVLSKTMAELEAME
ncbi:MAG: dihydroorotase [Clostridiales Family XIII bacterium]|jgi:dihydroorotase|nr:dihydroorotase [Clostridiales Family XIII bacterium]